MFDFNDVGDLPAMIGEPDKPARENQAQEQETASGDLPVTFAQYEVGVSFVPFATRFEIWVVLHANASPRKLKLTHQSASRWICWLSKFLASGWQSSNRKTDQNELVPRSSRSRTRPGSSLP